MRTFLTKQALQQIQAGIAETLRPSWQQTLPSNFGSAEHGKLKADQWRTSFEFDLPVSLVQILDRQSLSKDSTSYKHALDIIQNTMDLAMAIFWATSRHTSTHHAERCKFHMDNYIAGLLKLYPDQDLVPNHHYALHLHEMLLRFGPMHGWWAFPFERVVGLLQGINTNFKLGE